MQLIPSMDLMGGRVVRLRHGDPSQVTYYDLRPQRWIETLVEAGATRIHLVDLDGAFGQTRQGEFYEFPQRWPGVRFQLGGGIRSRTAIEVALAQGFDPVVGTLAVEQPSALTGFPEDRVVLALDMKEGRVCTRGWQGFGSCDTTDVFEALLTLGFRRALVTDVGRDGTLEGPGMDAIRTLVRAGFLVQASGGIRDLEDLELLEKEPGVTGAISGRALLEGHLNLGDSRLQRFLNVEV